MTDEPDSLAVLTPWTGYRAVSRAFPWAFPWNVPRVFPWVMQVQIVDDQSVSAAVFYQPRNGVCLNQGQFRPVSQTKESTCQVEMLWIQFDADGAPDGEEVVALMNGGPTTDAQNQCRLGWCPITAHPAQCGWCVQRGDGQKVPDAIGEGATWVVLRVKCAVGVETSGQAR